MKLHSDVEEFLRLNERVRAGLATAGERQRWESLKAQLLARRTTPPDTARFDPEPVLTALGGRRARTGS
ncbi:MAG: hypothetical protein ACK4N5_13730 [Myxococcales bacterium]